MLDIEDHHGSGTIVQQAQIYLKWEKKLDGDLLTIHYLLGRESWNCYNEFTQMIEMIHVMVYENPIYNWIVWYYNPINTLTNQGPVVHCSNVQPSPTSCGTAIERPRRSKSLEWFVPVWKTVGFWTFPNQQPTGRRCNGLSFIERGCRIERI